MRTLSRIECFNVGCTNEASVTINGDHVCTQCAQADLTVLDAAYVRACEVHGVCDYESFKAAFCPDHWCNKHAIHTGEGDICHMCEEEFDNARMLINLEMSKHQYSLWFVLSRQYLLKCPVANFDEAKMLYHSLSPVTGVRIARFDPTEGCESVLYKFKD